MEGRKSVAKESLKTQYTPQTLTLKQKVLKKRLNIFLLSLLLLVAGTFSVSAQIVDAEGQYVDTVFNDHVDRTAEDFVTVSLMIADAGAKFYTVLGHACLRLQCPTFGLDYCYSYESEVATNNVLNFLMGKLRMGLFAIPTEEYCAYYAAEGRGVREYILNLPPEVETNLWCVMDEHLAEGTTLDFDYYKRGCAITCVKFLKEALGQTRIQYDPSLYDYSPTARELGRKYTENARWVLFYWGFIAGEDVSVPLRGDKQLLMPEDLVQAWQKATLNGEPLIAAEPNVLVEGESQQADGWFTPLMAVLLLLVLAIANLLWKQPYWDWAMLAMQTVLGVILIYLMYFSNLCCTSWNWLLIPFNPLPAIFWYWRKYWALPYTGILLIWTFVMIGLALWGHILVDWSHILLVVVWMLIVLKQSKIIKQLCC